MVALKKVPRYAAREKRARKSEKERERDDFRIP